PGVPSRQNPLTPDENFNITDSIAKHHAKKLDQAGSLYYSKQNFDDYYFGKGSTYPDINGGIGILFEQASARGHLQNTTNGPLSFPFAIKNHFLTTLSTLEGAYAERDRLIDYQQSFYDKALTGARNDNTKAVVISDDGDPARLAALTDILLRHQITVYQLAGKVKINDTKIDRGIIVPFNQSQYLLIKSLFETRTRFADNTFYDVSSWTLPYAFNLPFERIERKSWRKKLLGKEISSAKLPEGKTEGLAKVAYAFDWNHYSAAAGLNQLLEQGLKIKVAGKAFEAETAGGKAAFAPGSIVVPVALQTIQPEQLHQLIQQAAIKFHLQISAINSGYAISGIDLGSSSMESLTRPKPLLLTGPGTSSYDTGELWHLIDQRLQMELTQAKLANFSKLSLKSYSHLILANGRYDSLKEEDVEAIKSWIGQGGVLIAMKSATKWVAENKLIEVDFKESKEDKDSEVEAKSYASMEKDNAQKVIGGSIFATNLDISHPLAYGYQREFLPVFRNHTLIMEPSSNPYATIVRYNKEPLLSGFVSNENLEKIAGSAMMVAERKGKGSVVLILDNPVFRGFWYGTSRLFINSLFFGTSFQNPAK
ncbi:MAG: zinc carboxypeptidase, partial [Gammaproteobacteria bacterium]